MSLVVGVGDLVVSQAPGETIVTYGLGSCLGITIFDPVAGVGGMLHAMLPTARIDPEGGRGNPARYLDTGIPLLFRQAYALGAAKERIILKMAGAGRPLGGDEARDSFQIGKRNVLMARQLLWKNGVLIRKEDVGGTHSRTLTLRLEDGSVSIRSGGEEHAL